jgi:hypothetical protein
VPEEVTVCVTRCDWPSVLHANKQLLDEGYTLFHHTARLTPKSGWATGSWSACWSRGKVDDFMGRKCLQMIRDIEVDSPFYPDINPMVDMFRSLRTIRLPQIVFSEGTIIFKDLTDSVLLSKVKAKSSILHVEELVAECPNWHIFSSIVVRAKNPPKGHIYEVSLILLNSSGRNTDKPSRAYTSTPISQPTLLATGG